MKLPAIALCLLVVGCSTRKVPENTPSIQPPAAGLRFPETIQPYHLGRYVDPAQPEILHEAHPLYRVETEATWDLRPGFTHSPQVSLDPTYAPPPASDAVTAEVNRQKDATERVMLEATRLAKAHEELTLVLSHLKEFASAHTKLAGQLKLMEERQSRLETKLEELSTTHRTTEPPFTAP